MSKYKKSKLKFITLKLPKPKKESYKFSKEIDAQRLRKIIKFKTKEIKKHLKFDGWDLNVGLYVENIIIELLGLDIAMLLIGEVVDKNTTCTLNTKGKMVFSKKDGYEPVFYNPVKNRIVIGKPGEYSPELEHIGCL